jgi:hypothetical protein
MDDESGIPSLQGGEDVNPRRKVRIGIDSLSKDGIGWRRIFPAVFEGDKWNFYHKGTIGTSTNRIGLEDNDQVLRVQHKGLNIFLL